MNNLFKGELTHNILDRLMLGAGPVLFALILFV